MVEYFVNEVLLFEFVGFDAILGCDGLQFLKGFLAEFVFAIHVICGLKFLFGCGLCGMVIYMHGADACIVAVHMWCMYNVPLLV